MPLTSQGFQVNVMPQLGRVDPRLFNTSGQLIGGFQSGLGAYGGLQNIADEAVARPVRRQLRDIKLAEAQNRMLMAPLEMAHRQAELSTPLQSVSGFEVERVPLPDVLQPVVDEEGVAVLDASGNPRMENVAGSGGADVFGVEIVTEVDPVTGARRQVRRRKNVLLTAEQLAQQASLMDSREAAALAAAERNATTRELGLLRADNEAIKAEAQSARAEAALFDPKWRTVSSGEDASGNLVINQVNAEGELRVIPTGQKKRSSNVFFGANFAAPAGTAATPGANPSLSDIAAKFRGGATKPAAPATIVTLTVEEARAAPPNTIFLGIDGKKRQKNANGTVSIIE